MSQPDETWKNSPTAWFVVLERASREGNAALIEKATAELRRLGVHVSLDPAPTGGRA
jgi:hypothetical protein